MIVWGGEDDDFNTLDTGGRYDLVEDAWIPTSTVGAPTARKLHTSVWSGHEMIVWGGGEYQPDETGGARYSPQDDRWSPVAATEIPGPSIGHTAIWTGDRMIIWDGGENALGGAYAPDGVDADGDGFGCLLDCDDGDSAIFAPAITVGGLRFAANGVTLEWVSAAPVSGAGTVYDIVRGEGAGFPVGSGPEVCVQAGYPPGGGTGLIALDLNDDPDPGELHWYLVRPTNHCGVGNYGATSEGVTRVCNACG